VQIEYQTLGWTVTLCVRSFHFAVVCQPVCQLTLQLCFGIQRYRVTVISFHVRVSSPVAWLVAVATICAVWILGASFAVPSALSKYLAIDHQNKNSRWQISGFPLVFSGMFRRFTVSLCVSLHPHPVPPSSSAG